MRYIPGNAQNIGSRQSQQDSFGFGEMDEAFVAHAGFLAIVCDGMGGMQHGDLASKQAVKTVLEEYRIKTPEESIPEALERCTRAANAAVSDLSHAMGGADGLGTTLVACVLHETNLYWISVGDSNAYLCRQGNMMLLTQAHVFSNLLDKAVAHGTIAREDADRHPERDSLTSFVGIEHLEEIDHNTQPFPLADGDTILIASDGLFKTLSDSEIVSMTQGAPNGWPELLVARTMAAQREHQDNVTVVTVTVTSAEPGFVPLPPPSGIRVPPATPVGMASGIGIPVPAGLPPMPPPAQPYMAPAPLAPSSTPPAESILADAPAPAIPGTPAPFPPPSMPVSGITVPAPPPPTSAPSNWRWWPALILAAILGAAAALYFVKREPARPTAPTSGPMRPDSRAPIPIQTSPLPGVQAPALEPGRLIRPEPEGGGDKVASPKIETEKPKPEPDKPKPEGKK